jgi:glycosyltransferase involved in cell wall biosynthesis
MRTTVAIIVATHDRPEWLEVCLYSILASAATVRRKGVSTSILVVDDCSATMEAQDVAKRVGVDYFRMAQNSGVAATLATGFALTDSEYTSFWGDDDYMLPRWFERHMGLANRGFDVVSSDYWMTDEHLVPTEVKRLDRMRFARMLAGHISVNDGSLLRRSATSYSPWRPERERAMMMAMWLALAARNIRFDCVHEPTWLYRRHHGNMSRRLSPHDMELRRQAIAEYAGVKAA